MSNANTTSAVFFCHPGFAGACAPAAHLAIADRAADLVANIDVHNVEAHFEMTSATLFESELWFLGDAAAESQRGVSKRATTQLKKAKTFKFFKEFTGAANYDELLVDRRGGRNHYSAQTTDVLLVAARKHLTTHFAHKFDNCEWLEVADFLSLVHQMTSNSTVLEIMLAEFNRISTNADMADPDVLWFMAPKLGVVHDVPAAKQYLRTKVFA